MRKRSGNRRSSADTSTRFFDARFLAGITLGVITTLSYHRFSDLLGVLDPSQFYVATAQANDFLAPTVKVAATTLSAERLVKYVQKYHYVLPSSRYDYMLYPAKECGEGPPFDPFFQLPHQVRSRMNEDKKIYETFFQAHSNLTGEAGTYVELGAYDGSQESNTHFYDKCLGWKGLLIEGNPESYHKVVTNRRFAHKMSLAPSCSAEYERVNHTVPFYRYPITNVGLVGHAISYQGKPTVDVPCGPLTPILQDVFEGKPILFFSLDVEGAERLVLDTIDFAQVTIYVMMIEIKNNHCQGDACPVRIAVREKMKQEGYLRYQGLVPASDVYVHPRSPYQIPASTMQPVG